MTFGVITINMFQTWMGGLIIKRFSALVAKFAACFTVVLTVMISGTFLKPCQADPLPLAMLSLTFIIAFGTTLFGMAKDVAPPSPPPAQVPAHEPLVSSERETGAIQLQDGRRT